MKFKRLKGGLDARVVSDPSFAPASSPNKPTISIEVRQWSIVPTYVRVSDLKTDNSQVAQIFSRNHKKHLIAPHVRKFLSTDGYSLNQVIVGDWEPKGSAGNCALISGNITSYKNFNDNVSDFIGSTLSECLVTIT